LIEAGLVAARILQFAAVTALFGLALFPLYSYPSGVSERPAMLSHWLRNALRWAAGLALLGNLLWGLFTVANMAGTLNAVADRDTLLSIALETSFGQVWVARLALAVTLLVLLAGRWHRHWIVLFASATLLASLAFVGHTQISDGSLHFIHVGADGIHLLAAGAWLGGLLALGHLLMLTLQGPTPGHTADVTAALVRFSGMGYIAVAALIGSGLINAWVLVGSVANLTTTLYGQLLLAKISLLVGMLVLAALNRFRLIPSLLRSNEGSQQAAIALRRLRRNVIGEQMLGLAVVFVVGYLGTMPPAIGASE
jgi:putative copper resistance protein D